MPARRLRAAAGRQPAAAAAFSSLQMAERPEVSEKRCAAVKGRLQARPRGDDLNAPAASGGGRGPPAPGSRRGSSLKVFVLLDVRAGWPAAGLYPTKSVELPDLHIVSMSALHAPPRPSTPLAPPALAMALAHVALARSMACCIIMLCHQSGKEALSQPDQGSRAITGPSRVADVQAAAGAVGHPPATGCQRGGRRAR